jgi:hypothetical protein
MHLYNQWNESTLVYNLDTCVIVITFVVLVWKKENVSQENIYIYIYIFYNLDTCMIVITFVVLVWKKENVIQENIYIYTYYIPLFFISLIQIDFVCVHV